MSEELSDKILIELVSIKGEMKNFVTKDDLRESEARVLGTVDRFVKLHETLDHELVALRHKYDRLEERAAQLERISA